jgi:hypothetical protein
VDAVGKLRRNEAQGWGKTRQERERRKQENKKAPCQFDDRLVVDEQGMVRSAEEYVEAGLARYEKELGYGEPRPRRPVVDEVVPSVPDFARWVAEKEKRDKEDRDRVARDNGAKRDRASAEEGASAIGDFPVMPVGKGEGANVQNNVGQFSVFSRQVPKA